MAIILKHSQNFLKSRGLVRQLIFDSQITSDDLILEIGAGKGIITELLAEVSQKVIAYEVDSQLLELLERKFASNNKIELKNTDFLTATLPTTPYKVFANIPFNITAKVIQKLLFSSNPPVEAFLIMQKESALKYVGLSKGGNTLIATKLKPWFEFELKHSFDPADFQPKPGVDIVLLGIRKRLKPLLTSQNKKLYRDFITYAYNHSVPNIQVGLKKIFSKPQFQALAREVGFKPLVTPTQLGVSQWIAIFGEFLQTSDQRKQQLVIGSEQKDLQEQLKIQKVYRTRSDPDWKLKK